MRLVHAFHFLLLFSFFLFCQWEGISYGGDSLRAAESLIDKYLSIEKELETSSLPIPFYLESAVNNNASHADIYGVIKHPFPIVENELQSSPGWCDILLLNPYVRACTYEKADDTRQFTVYEVQRFNEPLEDAYQVKFRYRLLELHPAFFDISLAAPWGPFNTMDHRFSLEAIPLDEGTTFIHLRYSFSYTFLAYLAMNEYLSVFHRGKAGFSIRSVDRKGNPVYVDGLRGAIERNVVRYYLAILAYMDTLKVPLEQRFEMRISEWYDLTARFKKQLFEMEEEEYLADKRKDQENQGILQAALNK